MQVRCTFVAGGMRFDAGSLQPVRPISSSAVSGTHTGCAHELLFPVRTARPESSVRQHSRRTGSTAHSRGTIYLLTYCSVIMNIIKLQDNPGAGLQHRDPPGPSAEAGELLCNRGTDFQSVRAEPDGLKNRPTTSHLSWAGTLE